MCEARRYGDETQCARCGLAWDTNDPDRPQCRTDQQVRRARAERAYAKWIAVIRALIP